MPAIVTCPSCNATLKPKTPLPAGARVKCPKCHNVFVVPAEEETPTAPAQRSAGSTSGAARVEAALPPEYEEEAASARTGEAEPEDGATSPAKPKKKGIPLWVWLTGGAGVLVLFCCGGCGIFSMMAPSLLGIKQGAESASVSVTNYDKIQRGMTEAQVKAIMGEPTLQGGLAGIKSEVWKSGEDSITLGFQNDKVIQRQMNILGTTKQGW